tara:strand:- start:18 stop:698 length:681 start_codon:yes stop_codon:yes gene_type:complete
MKRLINKAINAAKKLRKAELEFQGSAHGAFVLAFAEAYRAIAKEAREDFIEDVAEALAKSASSHNNWIKQADVYTVAMDVEGFEALPVGSMHRIVGELQGFRWKAIAKDSDSDVFYMTEEGRDACREALIDWMDPKHGEKAGKDSAFPLRKKVGNKADKATGDDAPDSEGQSTKAPFVQVESALATIIDKLSTHAVEFTPDQMALIQGQLAEAAEIVEASATVASA